MEVEDPSRLAKQELRDRGVEATCAAGELAGCVAQRATSQLLQHTIGSFVASEKVVERSEEALRLIKQGMAELEEGLDLVGAALGAPALPTVGIKGTERHREASASREGSIPG